MDAGWTGKVPCVVFTRQILFDFFKFGSGEGVKATRPTFGYRPAVITAFKVADIPAERLQDQSVNLEALDAVRNDFESLLEELHFDRRSAMDTLNPADWTKFIRSFDMF